MTTEPKTIDYGTLEDDGDTWLLMRPGRMILLDVPFVVDESLEHKTVSAIGRMGIPASARGITKLIVEKLVSHSAIAKRAYEIYDSDRGGSADDNWLRAEHELLGV